MQERRLPKKGYRILSSGFLPWNDGSRHELVKRKFGNEVWNHRTWTLTTSPYSASTFTLKIFLININYFWRKASFGARVWLFTWAYFLLSVSESCLMYCVISPLNHEEISDSLEDEWDRRTFSTTYQDLFQSYSNSVSVIFVWGWRNRSLEWIDL